MTAKAANGNGTRAFEKLLRATVEQTRVMTQMAEVQRENKDAVVNNGDAVIALGGLIEKQTGVLEGMKTELATAAPRTASAVLELKAHVTQTLKESDQRLYRWVLFGGLCVFIATSLGNGLIEVLGLWLKLPH